MQTVPKYLFVLIKYFSVPVYVVVAKAPYSLITTPTATRCFEIFVTK